MAAVTMATVYAMHFFPLRNVNFYQVPPSYQIEVFGSIIVENPFFDKFSIPELNTAQWPVFFRVAWSSPGISDDRGTPLDFNGAWQLLVLCTM